MRIATDDMGNDYDADKAEQLLQQWRPWLEQMARRQAAVGLFVTRVGTLHPLPSTIRQSAKSAYRRGYMQGFSNAMDHLRDVCLEKGWAALADRFDKELTPWGYGQKSISMEIPPL